MTGTLMPPADYVVPGGMTELKSLNANGTPPRTRMNSAIAARDMFNRSVRANLKRSQRNALVMGLVDGNPPLVDAELAKSGQRYRANFNNGQAEAYLGIAITAFYDLFNEVDTHARIICEDRDPMASEWSEIITRHFDWLNEQDDGFDYGIQLSIHDRVLFGAGPHVFEPNLDWRSNPVPFEDMYLPRLAKSKVSDWEWVDFSYTFTVSKLWEFISDEEAAKLAGWDVAAVKRSIMLAGEMMNQSGQGEEDWRKWETWQHALRNNDLWLGERCRSVRVVRSFFKEFSIDGQPSTISEAWFDQNDAAGDAFLFQKINAYENMNQVVCPFFYDSGSGMARSVRGLGVKMYKLLLAKNRLQLATVDAAFSRASIMLKSLGGGAGQQALGITHFGPYSVIPNTFEFVPTGVPGVIDAPLAVSRDLDNTLASNLSQYRTEQNKTEGNPRTAYEISQNVQQASAIAKTQVSRYYEQLDDWYSERFRRAANLNIPETSKNKWLRLALKFQHKCEEDGVPRRALLKCKVKASRATGQGSTASKMQMLLLMLNNIAPLLPEIGQKRLVKELISAGAGREASNYYMPDNPFSMEEKRQRWEAQMENNTFPLGGQVEANDTQNDVWHLDEHFSFINNAAASLQQGGDPSTVWRTLDSGGRHAAQHLQTLSKQALKKKQFEFFKEQFMVTAQLTEQLQQQLEQQQSQQAQEQASMAQENQDLQIKRQKIEGDLALKKEKQDGTAALKTQKLGFDMNQKTTKQQFDMAVKDAQAAHGIKLLEKKAGQNSVSA